MKNLLKTALIMVLEIVVFTFLITLFKYFNIMSSDVIYILRLINMVVISLIGGFIIGKKSLTKGYLNGLKLGLMLYVVLFLINVIFIKFKLLDIVYYLALILITMVGSMIGIQKKD